MRLLIVDDNELSREMAEDITEAMGLEVTGAGSGPEAIELAQKLMPEAVLMDYMMPEMDGAQTSIRLHELEAFANLPIIAMTAEEDPDIIRTLLEAGMCAVIHKPIKPETLYKTLSEYTEENLKKPENNSSKLPEEDEELRAMKEAGFDIGSGISYTGSVKSYKMYAYDFNRLLPEILEALDGYIRAEEYETFTVSIHGLKSNFRALGHRDYFKRCLQCEEAGKKGSYNEMCSLYEGDRASFEACKMALQHIFSGREQLEELSPGMLRSALLELKDAMLTYDLDTADVIIEDMEKHRIAPELEADMGRLYRQVAGLKYQAAAESIDGLLARGIGGRNG